MVRASLRDLRLRRNADNVMWSYEIKSGYISNQTYIDQQSMKLTNEKFLNTLKWLHEYYSPSWYMQSDVKQKENDILLLGDGRVDQTIKDSFIISYKSDDLMVHGKRHTLMMKLGECPSEHDKIEDSLAISEVAPAKPIEPEVALPIEPEVALPIEPVVVPPIEPEIAPTMKPAMDNQTRDSSNICEKIKGDDWQTINSKEILGDILKTDLPETFPKNLQVINKYGDIMIKINGADIYNENQNNSIFNEKLEAVHWLKNQMKYFSGDDENPLHVKSNLIATMSSSSKTSNLKICYFDYKDSERREKCVDAEDLRKTNRIIQNSNAIEMSQTENGKILEKKFLDSYLTSIIGDLTLQGTFYEFVFTMCPCPHICKRVPKTGLIEIHDALGIQRILSKQYVFLHRSPDDIKWILEGTNIFSPKRVNYYEAGNPSTWDIARAYGSKLNGYTFDRVDSSWYVIMKGDVSIKKICGLTNNNGVISDKCNSFNNYQFQYYVPESERYLKISQEKRGVLLTETYANSVILKNFRGIFFITQLFYKKGKKNSPKDGIHNLVTVLSKCSESELTCVSSEKDCCITKDYEDVPVPLENNTRYLDAQDLCYLVKFYKTYNVINLQTFGDTLKNVKLRNCNGLVEIKWVAKIEANYKDGRTTFDLFTDEEINTMMRLEHIKDFIIETSQVEFQLHNLNVNSTSKFSMIANNDMNLTTTTIMASDYMKVTLTQRERGVLVEGQLAYDKFDTKFIDGHLLIRADYHESELMSKDIGKLIPAPYLVCSKILKKC
ncbi:unnamed protein product [Gordionus sp. m RMFG-2023]